MSKAKLALFSWALLFCVSVAGSQTAPGQGAARSAQVSVATPDASVTETIVDSNVRDDKRVDKMLKLYSPKVRALDAIIGKLKGDLRKGGTGAGSLGNFVTDAIRAEASQKLGKPILLAVTNGGGLRKSAIAEGDLRLRDIFELLPFENALVAFDLTGAQVMDLLRIVVAHRDAQSGARIKYRVTSDKRAELETARLLIGGSDKTIDPAAVYTIISIDYLLNVTGGDYTVLREARNIRPLGLTMRDAVTDYIKKETAAGRAINPSLDGRFVFDKAASPGVTEPQP